MTHPLHYKETALGPRIPSASFRHNRTVTSTRRKYKHSIVFHSTWYKISVRPIACGRTIGVLPAPVVRRDFRTTSIYEAVHYFAAMHVGIKSAGIILETNHEALSDCSLRSVVGRLKLAIIRGHPVTRHARAIMGVAGDLAEGLLERNDAW